MRKQSKGITLIALVITIIILLILAGISIASLTGSGIFAQTQLSKEKNQYVAAKEVITIRLMEIAIEKQNVYTIVDIANNMKEADNITIEKYFNSEVASIKPGITEEITNLKGIAISVDEYSEYKFLIGRECKVSGVLKGEINDTTQETDFKTIAQFEKEKFNISSENSQQPEQPEISEPPVATYTIEKDLQDWLTATNQTIKLEDIASNETIMTQVTGLIPTLTQNDVTRTVGEDETIYYTLSNGEKINVISEYDDSEKYYAWKVFDSDYTYQTCTHSKRDNAEGYYLSYEFNEYVKAVSTRLCITNHSYTVGQRTIKIQGYNDTNNVWEDLTQEITYEGNIESGYPDEYIALNTNNLYKKYRIYVTSIGNSTGAGADVSGVCRWQIYGIKTTDREIDEKEVINIMLDNTNINQLTVANMVNSKTLTQRLINLDETVNIILENSKIRDAVFSSQVALQYAHKINDIVDTPTLVDTNKYSTTSGDLIYSSTTEPFYSRAAYRGFDGQYINTAASWPYDWSVSASSTYPSEQNYYLTYEFAQPVFVYKFKYQVSHVSSTAGARKYVIQASNDGENWVDITNPTEHSGARWVDTCDLIPQYTESNVNKYKMFRIYTLEMSGDLEVNGVGEFEIFGIR